MTKPCLTHPRPPMIDAAFRLAQQWCRGHTIDEAPAIRHAVAVTNTVERHLDPAPLALLAATLLHDAPDLAPADVDVDAVLTGLDPTVTRIVRAMQAEHLALDAEATAQIPVDDRLVLIASAADKIVALESARRRAALRGDPDPYAFWRARPALLAVVPYFRSFHTAAAAHLPVTMAVALGEVVGQAERVSAALAAAPPPASPPPHPADR